MTNDKPNETVTTVTFEEGTGLEVSPPPNNDGGGNGVSSSGNNNGEPRRRFVSSYKREQERIKTDSVQSTKYDVPQSSIIGGVGGNRKKAFPPKAISNSIDDLSNRSFVDWMETFLPMTRWLKSYQWKTNLPKDIVAGCTVGIMIIPQSMSYAKLAGLPVEYGLYSALTPVFAYSFFGSSRQLAVGPVALVSLLLSTGITHYMSRHDISIETVGPEMYKQMYTTLAIQICFLVGVVNLVLGFLRLGFITIFLSHAVISGFTTGAAVIIGMSQVKYIFGYEVQRSDVIHEVIEHIFAHIDQFNYKTFVVGIVSTIILVVMKNIGKTFPSLKWTRAIGPLTVSAIGIILNVAFNLDEKGVPAVGAIPKGFPSFTVNKWTPIDDFGDLFVVVISIVIVGFMESIAIAKQLASKHKYEIDSSVELIGLGMSNFVGAMFQSYPVTGSFSRSAVNNESGAVSGFSGMVTAIIVGLVLLFLTTVFEKMPLAVLASIVISGVLGLLDYEEAIYLYRVHKSDFAAWMVACLGTMFLGVEMGLVVAVGLSLLLVTYESAYPHTAVLGRLPGTPVYRNIKNFPEAERYDGIVMVRIDAPIYFANSQNVREKIRKYERLAEERWAQNNQQAEAVDDDINNGNNSVADTSVTNGNGGGVKFIIIELNAVPHIDTTALHLFDDMVQTYNDRGIEFCLANPCIQVMDKLVLSGLADKIGRDHIFNDMHDAVHWCLDQMDIEILSIYKPNDIGDNIDDIMDDLASLPSVREDNHDAEGEGLSNDNQIKESEEMV